MLPPKTLICAQLSSDCYNDGGAELEGFHKIHLCEEELQADLLWNDQQVFLVFRGTDSFKDVLRDLNIFGGGNAHQGFRDGFTSLQWILSDKLQAIDGLDGKDFTITGHSLGGALAVMAAYSLPTPVNTVITFGAPRVGDGDFSRLYRSTGNWGNTHQFINGADQVPRMQLFREHVGNVLLLSKNRVILNPRSWRLLRAFLFARPSRRITDHFMKNYIRSCETCN